MTRVERTLVELALARWPRCAVCDALSAVKQYDGRRLCPVHAKGTDIHGLTSAGYEQMVQLEQLFYGHSRGGP